jgi:hypothetical protein
MHGSANGRADTKLTWRGRNPKRPLGTVVAPFFQRRRARLRPSKQPVGARSFATGVARLTKVNTGPPVIIEIG